MSLTVLGSNGGGGYNLESSLRFRSSASAYLYDELLFTATTPSTTAVSARVINTYTDLQLMPGQSIFVGSSIALTSTQSLTIWASGGDL